MPRKVRISWRPGEPRIRRSAEDCLGRAQEIVEAWAPPASVDRKALETAIAGIFAQHESWEAHAKTAASKGEARENLRQIATAAEEVKSGGPSAADELHNLLVSCCDDAAFLLGRSLVADAWRVDVSPQAIYGQLGRFALIPDVVARVAALNVGVLGTSRGPSLDMDLMLTISELRDTYEQFVHWPATHTRYRRTVYMGAPQSDFGRLCVAFFAQASPSLPPTRISTELCRLLKGRRGKLGLRF